MRLISLAMVVVAAGFIFRCSTDDMDSSRLNELDDATSVEECPRNPGLWLVHCRWGNSELRTTEEIRADIVCEGEPDRSRIMHMTTLRNTFLQVHDDGSNCYLPRYLKLELAQVPRSYRKNWRRMLDIVSKDPIPDCSSMEGTVYYYDVKVVSYPRNPPPEEARCPGL